MPYFTLHRDFTLRTTKGHTIGFVKDAKTWVPPSCVPDAVGIGAIAQEEVEDVLGVEAKPVVQLEPHERKARLNEAFKVLVKRNERGDFTASGLPHCKKLESLVGFEVFTPERDEAWMDYRQTMDA